MACMKYKRRFDANQGEVLVLLPPHISQSYPVEPKFALANKSCHLADSTTSVFDTLMVTYANEYKYKTLPSSAPPWNVQAVLLLY